MLGKSGENQSCLGGIDFQRFPTRLMKVFNHKGIRILTVNKCKIKGGENVEGRQKKNQDSKAWLLAKRCSRKLTIPVRLALSVYRLCGLKRKEKHFGSTLLHS